MPRIPIHLIIAVVTAATSITLLIWSLTPSSRTTLRQILPPERTLLPEVRTLLLDFPVVIRAGEPERVQLTVEADAQATGGANVYITDTVIAEARLDLGGMNVQPAETVSEPLLSNHGVSFFWNVQPVETGRFSGTVWFYLRFIPKDGGPERRQTISAQAIEIESVTLFGIHPEPARWLGMASAFIASLFGTPFVVDALKWLWKRGKN